MSYAVIKRGSFRSTSNKPIIAGLLLLTLTVVGLAGPCLAFRLPWTASDENVFQDLLNEIWSAILENNRAALKTMIVGFGTDAFIAQERQFARTVGASSFSIKVRSVRFDHLKAFAFVDFERIGTLKNGTAVSHRFLKTFRREGQNWKLVANAVKKKRR